MYNEISQTISASPKNIGENIGKLDANTFQSTSWSGFNISEDYSSSTQSTDVDGEAPLCGVLSQPSIVSRKGGVLTKSGIETLSTFLYNSSNILDVDGITSHSVPRGAGSISKAEREYATGPSALRRYSAEQAPTWSPAERGLSAKLRGE